MDTSLTEFIAYLNQLAPEIALWWSIVGLILFTIALCIGWLLGRRRVSTLRKQVELIQREKVQLQERLQTNEEEQKSLARELVALTTEKDEVLVQLQTAQRRNMELNHSLTETRTSNEQLRATNQSYATTIEDLNDQVIGLKTRNELLQQGSSAGGDAGAKPDQLDDRITSLERRLDQLTQSNAAASRPTTIRTGRSTHQIEIGQPYDPAEEATDQPAVDDSGDDLTKISSIGPFNQRKLREAGIVSYAQIAAWEDADIDTYAARIGYVAELIREEDWIGQARRLDEAQA
ncbi:hypothetical protein LEM8419_01874 [Neolewinella maritima]|uniref:Flap endonuclease-1-like 5' DNA nuclease n=1 Tax=Neolewinella maritima TaxID=1383882 RepID=A0ABM9B1F6_9BACT|nr:hypothetical protein [Neolewinella maritima]CAH1000766.1 hypothetical protein LEM8419_01874 [Neolewinella maritima]